MSDFEVMFDAFIGVGLFFSIIICLSFIVVLVIFLCGLFIDGMKKVRKLKLMLSNRLPDKLFNKSANKFKK